MQKSFDVIVIGGGPGGYVCAIRSAQLGFKTACVESRSTLGGVCLNEGCIPSKSLLNSSEIYHKARKEFNGLGIETKSIKLNLSKMMNNKNKSVLTLTKGVEYLFKKNKITYLKGNGSITSQNTVTVVDEQGNELPSNTKGYLVIRKPWPGMLLTLWGDDEKYKNVYWSKFENNYYSGDYAIKDSDGYFWLLGRADDILKVAGHRIGTAELESSLVSHSDIAEAAVCGIPNEIKGEVIVAFVVLKQNAKKTRELLRTELIETVRNGIGPIATPRQIYFVTKLPKTRSGKIMRRVLKAIASNEKIGDVSTLEDGAAVKDVQDAFTELERTVRENKS